LKEGVGGNIKTSAISHEQATSQDSDESVEAEKVTAASVKSKKRRAANPANDETLFERFWAAYPKRRNRGQAEKAFKKAAPDEQLMAAILTAIERATKSAQWLKDDGQFIPYPATWLNARGWEDEYDTTGPGNSGEWDSVYDPDRIPPDARTKGPDKWKDDG
jgi:hypothetical protein